ncbi:hypothetical protein N431DRAFT_418365 [Stipitochalara longipes BDJ]|nr:hypothetical protein N431DRAFT_418365 [Stipitochalara longipes BDJ]
MNEASYPTTHVTTQIMDSKPLPGAFILQAAEHGLKAASILPSFSPSAKSKSLASKISLSATLLSEIGKQVNLTAACFKENFQQTFEHVPMKCEEQYVKVLKALEKASSFDKSDLEEGTPSKPQKPWERLRSALDMNKAQFEEFRESLDESWHRVLMLQHIVSLIVLQIRAQNQEPLTLSEYNKLGQLKKGMGKLFKTIREEKIASVITFSLVDLNKPANASQLITAAESVAQQESCSRDDVSIVSSSATVLNSPVQETAPIKQRTATRPPPPPPFVAPPKDDDEYEMYRVSVNTHEKESAHTRPRLFGIPGLVNLGRTKTEVVSHVDKIPSSIPEIKAFIMREKDDEYTVPPTINDLVNVSPKISTAIYTLVNDKNKETCRYPYRQWTTEFLVNWEWWDSKRFGRKQKKTDGYIVILRGKADPPPPPPPCNWPGSPPPPPPGYRSGPPVIINQWKYQSKQEKMDELGLVTDVLLTQHETEKVINDFLATFSTLYDGIPVEERGAAMRGIDMKEIDELCDYESDDSDDSSGWSSNSSDSLVDD